MCGHEEWQRFARRFEQAISEERVHEFVADALAQVETLIEEFKAGPCSPENGDWANGHCGRSRPEWVA
jgi:hypothetical protein